MIVRGDGRLPEAPRLHSPAPPDTGEPTPQTPQRDVDGSPLALLSTCRWCGGMHPTACPYIKVAEWHPTGQLARIVLQERPALVQAILYPFETDEEIAALRRGLEAITDADTLERAQGYARALLAALEEPASAAAASA